MCNDITKNCKVCGNKTNTIFNIKLKKVYICENCATSIFLQQALWYVETAKLNPPFN